MKSASSFPVMGTAIRKVMFITVTDILCRRDGGVIPSSCRAHSSYVETGIHTAVGAELWCAQFGDYRQLARTARSRKNMLNMQIYQDFGHVRHTIRYPENFGNLER